MAITLQPSNAIFGYRKKKGERNIGGGEGKGEKGRGKGEERQG